MFVSVEEFSKLQSKVDDLFKAVKSSHESSKGLKSKVQSIEVKYKKLEEDVINREDFDTLDGEIENLREERKQNLAEIKHIEIRLRKLQDGQNGLKETTTQLENHRKTTSSKINELTTKISLIPTNITEDNAAKFKCKQCDIKFLKKANLQNHIETNHPKSIVCKLCGDKFSEIHQLEDHLQKVHKRSKRFLCGVCNTGFLMRWRLHKHLEMHKKGEAQRFCHYFNNKKKCPYQDVGCKFLHEESPDCRFEHLCSRQLCQYRHD